MLMGFNLNHWMEIWTLRLDPTIEHYGEPMKLSTRFNHIVKLSEIKEELRSKLFGDTKILEQPVELMIGNVMTEYSLAGQWFDLPLKERARFIAMYRVKAMMQTLEQYNRVMDQERKKNAN